jgi:ParB family chromosome partitioning protein
MRDGFISMGHGRALITIEDQAIQLDIYEKILSNKLSVRETENLVRDFNTPSDKKTTTDKSESEDMPKFVKKGITAFSEYFGHKIDVKVSKNGKGKITIPFHSEEDFNRIKKLVQGDSK